ncbi:hypothetical protein Q8W15_16270, partial [Photobacterium damselae subsp. piscicida]|nr:hypothetical protein [Photobacterium damselae subsp. piscicida]MDP2558416.1 hypothetical protein [Photobacterium damselae subsp. piscicida]
NRGVAHFDRSNKRPSAAISIGEPMSDPIPNMNFVVKVADSADVAIDRTRQSPLIIVEFIRGLIP